MRKSTDQFKDMVDKIPTLAWSCRPDGTAEFLNQRWLDYTGLALEEALGWGWKVAIHSEDLGKLMDTWQSILRSGEAGEEEARLRRFDGEYRWFLFRAVPVTDGQARIVRWYGTNTDIEDLKRAESLLSAEKRTLEMIAGGASLTEILENLCNTIDAQSPNSSSTILLLDADGKRLWPAAGPRVPKGWTHAITPVTIGPSMGSCGTAAFLRKLVISEDIANDPAWAGYQDLAFSYGLRASWSQPIISKNHDLLGTFAMYYPDRRRPSDSDLQLIEGAAHIALVAIERNRAEEAARAAKARFEGILAIAQDAIISVDSNQLIVLFNQGAEKVFGYQQSELIGKPIDVLLPEHLENVLRKYVEDFAQSQDVARTMGQRRQVSGRRKDGTEFPAEASISKLDVDGKLVFTVILRDITARKRAESRLKTQYAITGILSESSSIDEAAPRIVQAICECLDWKVGEIWRVDGETKFLTFAKAWHLPSGDLPEFVAASLQFTFPPGVGVPGRVCESRKPLWIRNLADDPDFHRISLAKKVGLDCGFGFPILLGEEAIGAMVFFSREVRDPDHDVLEMMANIGSQIGQFIERRRAEHELRRSEAYLAEAQRLSLTGSFGWNVSTGELFWSRETFCILGYDQTMKPALELVLKRVHPEDVALVQEIFDRASRDRTDVDFEHRLVLPDDTVKHVHVVAHATKDGSGGLEFVGAVSDVTLAKTAQERIRQTEKEFRQIVDLIPQFIAVLGPDGSALYVNQTLLEYTGLPTEVFHTIDFRKHVFHPDDVERLRDERQKALRSGVPFQLEQRARGKDGQYRWFLIQYNPLKNEQGDILRWYATGTDIDDRKRAEQRIRDENMALREEIDRTSMYEEIVGSSRPLRTVISQISKVAPTDSTVMIFGETGTGKELIAAAIHKRSKRATKAFIRVNCAAIPPSLIASELFGHEKGAFTGAFQRRAGRFESADGGTIFLDEIGELSLETQATLLRVLQEHEIERVGSSRQISVDVRVLAATNRDLEAAVAAGTFREDLFYRLNVFPIRVPALRERRDDIPTLVKYLVERHAKSTGRKINHITKQTLDLFQTYNWPGNIRELQNVVERAVILCDGDTFSVDESWLRRKPSPLSRRSVPRPGALAEDKKEFSQRERTAIEAALAECQGRVSGPHGAAAILGIPHQTLESKIATLGIDKRKFKVRSAGGPA